MNTRKLKYEELIQLRKLWSVCFLSEMNVADAERSLLENKDKPDSSTYYGVFLDDGTLVSGMAANHYQVHFDGHVVPFMGVGGVATHPSYRKGGAIRSIMEKLLREERENGCVFSGLYPFSHVFYRKFGYELARLKRTYTIPLSLLTPFACDVESKMLLPDDDRSHLLPVSDVFHERISLGFVRDAEMLKNRTRSNPYEKNDYTYALYENDSPIAYVCFRVAKTNGENHLRVTDFAYTTKDAFYKLLGFFARFSAQFTCLEISMPDDIPMHSIISAPYDITVSEGCDYMLRVVNTEKVLTLMKKDFDYRFVVEITDDFLPENGGRWLVTPGKCEKTDLPYDMKTDIQTFSQLISGFISFDAALFKLSMTVYSNESVLSRVFTKKPVFTDIYF